VRDSLSTQGHSIVHHDLYAEDFRPCLEADKAYSIGAKSWFCDPNSPWQKGAIENINKCIRQYLPSNTDLGQVSQAQWTALATISMQRRGSVLDLNTCRGLCYTFAGSRLIRSHK
jgi:hypothetical protein